MVACQTRTEQGDGRPYSAHAAARNAMLEAHLSHSHTHVLWIDADVVGYPTDLARRLEDDADIVAPLPLIEGTNRFYDVRGFVPHPSPYPPYWKKGAALEAAGTCYLARAEVYHEGALYSPTAGHTEHWSVCHGRRVRCAEDVIIYHANLPKWGEPWH